MSASISVKTQQIGYQYQLLPSAFKLAEYPTHFFWKLMTDSKDVWNRQAIDSWEWLKNHSVAVAMGASGYLGGFMTLPITIISIPFTLLADVITGIGEFAFCYYKGVKKDELLLIAHRKFVVSPCQHFTLFCCALIGYGMGNGFICHNADLYWPIIYAFARATVKNLTKYLSHFTYDILIEE